VGEISTNILLYLSDTKPFISVRGPHYKKTLIRLAVIGNSW